MNQKSAIIIGAGILGLAMAKALAAKGFNVKVFERTEKARGASVRNFGMIWPIGQPEGKLYETALRSKSVWLEMANQKVFWCDQVGSLHVANNAEEWHVLQEVAESMTKARLIRLLNPSETKTISPFVKSYHLVGSMFSAEEMIVDPVEAVINIPTFLEQQHGVEFYWGKTVVEVHQSKIVLSDKSVVQTDLVFICSGSDFDTLYPEWFEHSGLTKCKLQMMQLEFKGFSKRIGPALCGGLSLYHYKSFHSAPSFSKLVEKFQQDHKAELGLGIHVMVAQNKQGLLTVGDSHEYGNEFDPYLKNSTNQLILDYLSSFMHTEELQLVKMWEGVYAKPRGSIEQFMHQLDHGIYLVNGVGGAGMTLGFGVATEVADHF